MGPGINIEFQPASRPRWVSWALLVIAVLAVTELDIRKQELLDQIAVWRGTPVPTASARAATNPVEDQVREAGTVLEQLALPWSHLFGSLERAHSETIALLAVQPDAQRRSITLVGEAKGYADILEYVARLRSEAKLENVYLVSNELKEDQPQRPVAFTIIADWKGLR